MNLSNSKHDMRIISRAMIWALLSAYMSGSILVVAVLIVRLGGLFLDDLIIIVPALFMVISFVTIPAMLGGLALALWMQRISERTMPTLSKSFLTGVFFGIVIALGLSLFVISPYAEFVFGPHFAGSFGMTDWGVYTCLAVLFAAVSGGWVGTKINRDLGVREKGEV